MEIIVPAATVGLYLAMSGRRAIVSRLRAAHAPAFTRSKKSPPRDEQPWETRRGTALLRDPKEDLRQAQWRRWFWSLWFEVETRSFCTAGKHPDEAGVHLMGRRKFLESSPATIAADLDEKAWAIALDWWAQVGLIRLADRQGGRNIILVSGRMAERLHEIASTAKGWVAVPRGPVPPMLAFSISDEWRRASDEALRERATKSPPLGQSPDSA